jgi:hypothetical protein
VNWDKGQQLDRNAMASWVGIATKLLANVKVKEEFQVGGPYRY